VYSTGADYSPAPLCQKGYINYIYNYKYNINNKE
jgi:hypothetical protein